jgi:type VI secretion system protein VasJ
VQRRNYFTGLQQSGQWDKLLDEGEVTFAQPPFHLWLDLQRLIVAAMDALGSDFQNARMAILQELAILLQRVSKLSSLTFSDGTRFADPATQSWIEETVLPVLGGEAGGMGPGLVAGDGELAGQFDEAKKILSKGDLAGAVAYLQNGALPDTSRKARFRRRLYVATLCMRGNQPKLARPLLEDLSEEIEKFALAEWEPPLALEVWTNLKQCYESLVAAAPPAGKQLLQENAEHVFEKMCRVNVSYALATTGTKPKTKRPALPKVAKPKATPAEEPEAESAENVEGKDEREEEAANDQSGPTDEKAGAEPVATPDGKDKRGLTPAAANKKIKA